MKNLVILSILSLTLFSCGPSACDCVELLTLPPGTLYYEGETNQPGHLKRYNQHKKCTDRYRDKIDQSLVGTNDYRDELIRLTIEDCTD